MRAGIVGFELVMLNELEPGEEFIMFEDTIWRVLNDKPTIFVDVVQVENMEMGVKEALLRNADARYVVKVIRER